jgi:hypothetical protein
MSTWSQTTGVADGDSTKQWRLPVVRQEHRVWVAQRVKCDAPCKGYGADSCKEVVMLGSEYIGGRP